MKRILVLGPCASGKSTFAGKLGSLLDIQIIHLDSHYWQPNWKEPNTNKWQQKVDKLLEDDTWIIDGTYHCSIEQRLKLADTVFYLQANRVKCIWRMLKRYLQHRGTTRPDLPENCTERLEWEFTKYVWNFDKDIAPIVKQALQNAPHTNIIYIRNDRDSRNILRKLNK